MIVPGAVFVSVGDSGETSAVPFLSDDTDRATASLGDKIVQIWVEGKVHETVAMMSMSHDAGATWNRPVPISGTEFKPVSALICAGDGKFHVAWQDATTRLPRVGYQSIGLDGLFSKPVIFNGGNPYIAVSGNSLAISSSFRWQLAIQLSSDGGQSFTEIPAMDGLACSSGAISFENGALCLVAAAGISDPVTGILSSRGIYHSSFNGISWTPARIIAETGSADGLRLESGVVEWKETSDDSISHFRIRRAGSDVFTEKELVSSEEILSIPLPIGKLAPSKLPPKKWTFIVYLDGDDGTLDAFGVEDMNECELVGSNADINIIVLHDRLGAANTKCYYVTYDTNMGAINSPEIPLSSINASWGTELNMGNPQTAIDLMNYVFENYPAQHYFWDFWDHGGTWDWMQCSDSNAGGDMLTALETRTIYEKLRADSGRRYVWDVISFDECILADVEVFYDLKQYANYTVFSEASIGADGYEYDKILAHLVANPDMHPEELGYWTCREYYIAYPAGGQWSTLSLINNTIFDHDIMPVINSFGQKMRHRGSSLNSAIRTAANNAKDWEGVSYQADLRHFAQLIQSGIPAGTDAEINAVAGQLVNILQANPTTDYYGSPTWQNDRGILIHNSNTDENGIKIYCNQAYNSVYNTLMAAPELNWDAFVQNIWGTSSDVTNEEPSCSISDPSTGGTVVCDSIVTITGTAGDSDGTVQRVEVKIERESWQVASGTTSWSYAWNTAGWPVGPIRIQARSWDGVDYSESPSSILVQMVDVSSNGTVDIQFSKYPQEASVKVTVKDTDLNTGPGVQTTTISVTSVREPAGESMLLTETGGDTSVFEGFLTISGTNAAGILWVNAADTITATYNDANYGGSGPMTLTDTATVDGVPPGSPAGLTVEWYGLVQQDFFFEDFEGDGTPTFAELGWTLGGASNDWQIGTPSGLGGNYGNPDPVGAHGGTFSIGNDLTGLGTYPGDYEPNLATDSNWIRSPAIDCTGYSDVSLSFWRHLNVESPTYDHAYIEVSNDGTAFTQVWTNTALTTDTDWNEVSYDISVVADNHATVYIRFEIGASDGSWQYCGWNIDDLTVSGMTAGSQHNTVNWTLSSDDGAGADDVIAYNLYRSNVEAGPWDASTLIDTLPKGTSTYVDPDRGEYDGINWWYLVRAEDSLGNEDANTNAIPEIPLTNIAPSAPNTPTPSNGATGVSVNPTLSVRAADPNGDILTVRFYNAAGPTLIGTSYNVPSGTFTGIAWPGLSPLTSYSWYATADDGEFVTQSSTWSFTTMDTTPPGPPIGLMVEWAGTSSATLIDQDFTDATFPPTGWDVQSSGTTGTWSRQETANAGGTSPEARFYYGSNAEGISRLYAGPFDTTGMASLDLQWQNMINDYTGGSGVYCLVQTSSDLGTWHDTDWYWDDTETPGGMAAALESISVYTPDVGTSTFYISWTVEGNSYQLNYWYIDNILLTFTGGVTTDDNLLTWTLSPDDGAGVNDVVQYNIYRSVASSGPWDSGALIDTVPAGTASYQDIGRGEPDGINWWYVVRAQDVWGNEDSNTNAVPEAGTPPAPYHIVLTGISAPSWVMVSFPVDVSGTIQDILNDAALGDGMTTWDIAKWYNPDTPADPWKTYRAGGTANDMPNVNNRMGFWLHLTSNGGDQLLTLGALGPAPSSTVNVLLSPGWNLVGYPSGTVRSGLTTPVQVDIISVYSGSGTYDDHIDKSMVTLRPGNAYFMHVTAACNWPVDP